MRFLVPVFVFLAVAAFHSALSASLESAEKEEVVPQKDGLTKLMEIDQMEFEAAQKNEAAQMNVTEEQSEGSRYLEAVQEGSVEEPVESEATKAAEGGGKPDTESRGGGAVAPAQPAESSESSEEAQGVRVAAAQTVSTSGEDSQDSTKEDESD